MRVGFVPTVLLVVLAVANGACSLVITPPPPSAELNPNGVIFTADQTEESQDIFGSAFDGAWTPSSQDVAQLEADLPTFLESAENPWLREDPPIEDRVPTYMRQYLGIVEDGNEVIYANFFCTINDLDWHNEYVLVMDGGDCFFQVKYNPDTGEFYDLSVNGEG